MTNADHFRLQMQSDDNLAEFLSATITTLECPAEVFKAVEEGSSYLDAWKGFLKKPWRKDKSNSDICKIDLNVYTDEEVIYPATVQILTNRATHDVSVGWWRGTPEDMVR